MENVRSPLFDAVDRLLAPVPGERPTGQSPRYDPVVAEIRVAREEDDPSLPQGEWERPLKKADWPLVVKLCSQTLSERGKDLQIAAWLTEAWIHLEQIEGLRSGIRLIHGLLQNYWDDVHPRQSDEGDYDARVAPLAWLNDTLPLTLRLNIRLLAWPKRKPAFISLEDWTKAQLLASAKDEQATDSQQANTPSRNEMNQLVASTDAAGLLELRKSISQAMLEWKALDQFIDHKLGHDAPSMSRVTDTLALIDRAITSLLSNHPNHDTTPMWLHSGETMHSDPAEATANHLTEAGGGCHGLGKDTVTRDFRLANGPTRSRADAYRQLEDVANFLQRIEPHSPTPYLIRRAVSWGHMALPELMQEVLREEGDLNRLFAVLGLKPNA